MKEPRFKNGSSVWWKSNVYDVEDSVVNPNLPGYFYRLLDLIGEPANNGQAIPEHELMEA